MDGPGKRLTKAQREALISWAVAGLQTDEINSKAAAFDPPFTVSRRLVGFYRDRAGVNVAEEIERGQNDALRTGLAIRAERVRTLKDLAALLMNDVMGDSLWVSDVKAVNGNEVTIYRFNEPEVQQLRGVLEDIAKEMGDRKQAVQHSGDAENPVEVVHFYIPANGRD